MKAEPTPPGQSTPWLSIVIPFHNSQVNSARLLSTLNGLTHSFLEVICVDDGSTDETLILLGDFAATCPLPVKIIAQQNGGPGKARNTGLRHARGEYVWFVDCDDDIEVGAVNQFSELRSLGFDFIDFCLEEVGSGVINTMGLAEGAYDVSRDLRSHLVGNYGAIWTKVTRRNLLVSNEIWYPEFCFYEDNLLSSILPFYVRRFYRSGIVGYRHHLDFESITRQKLGPRYFDRLHT
jgi:glycosyltransferase involved in cell wall biosynthesis